jgi:hypothetical protein
MSDDRPAAIHYHPGPSMPPFRKDRGYLRRLAWDRERRLWWKAMLRTMRAAVGKKGEE